MSSGPNAAGEGDRPQLRLNAWAGACLLALAAAQLLTAIGSSQGSLGPRVLEQALLISALQLAGGAALAMAVARGLARWAGGRGAAASGVFCAVLIGTQAWFLKAALTRPGDAGTADAKALLRTPQAGAALLAADPDPPASQPARRRDLRTAAALLERAAAASAGDERFLIESTREVLLTLEPAEQRHDQAFAALQSAGGIDLRNIRSEDDLRRRLDLLEGLARAGEQLAVGLEELIPRLEQQLDTRLGFAAVRNFTDDFRRSAGLEDHLALRAAEASFCKESRRLLTMLLRRWGAWSPPPEGQLRPTFGDPQLSEDFDRVMTRILRHVVEQRQIRESLGM